MKAAALLALLLAAADGPAPQVLERAFVVRDMATGELSRTSRTVPNRAGTSCYEWILTVAPEPRTVELTETFTLPAPAPTWNTMADGSVTVAADRKSATSRLTADLSDGVVTNGWCVAAGDPTGVYRIAVKAGDAVLGTFEFVVVPDDDVI